ncbi:hypothetical protein GEMRC1_011310 [Eukaryota sp. GEM-RC1]
MDLKYVPLTGIVVTSLGIIFCLLFAPSYYDDVPDRIMYISEAGGRYPFLPLFSFSLSLGGLLIAVLSYIYADILLARTPTLAKSFGRIPIIIKTVAIVGGISLALVGLVSVYDNFLLHSGAAQVFFLLTMANAYLITYMSHHQTTVLEDSNPYVSRAKKWGFFRKFICYIMPVFVLPYLFLPTLLKLPWVPGFSAFFQYLSVLTLILFFISFRLEFDGIQISLSNVGKGLGYLLADDSDE